MEFHVTHSLMTTKNRQRAMSLVEVALAIGILAFALVGMMSLLPVGLNASRQSIEKGIELELRQTLQAYLITLPSSALPNSEIWQFDADGKLIPQGSTEGTPRYELEFTVAAQTTLPHQQGTTHLRTVQMEIRNRETGYTSFSSLHLPDNGL